jgi:hypothetical protein
MLQKKQKSGLHFDKRQPRDWLSDDNAIKDSARMQMNVASHKLACKGGKLTVVEIVSCFALGNVSIQTNDFLYFSTRHLEVLAYCYEPE